MVTDKRMSTAGRLIVAVVLLTALFSVDVTWGGFEFPHKGYVLFGLQVGLLLLAIGAGVWSARGMKRSVLVHPMFLLWASLFLFALGNSIVQADTWTIVKQTVLIIFPRVLLALAVLHDVSPVATFRQMAKGFVLLMVVAVALGFLVRSFGQPIVVSDEIATKTYIALEVGPLVTKVPLSRYYQFTRFAAPIGSGNPNAVGALLLTGILLTASLIASRSWSLMLGGALLVIQALAFLGTLSRTSWLSLVPALVVFLVLTARQLPQLIKRFSYLLLGSVIILPLALLNDNLVALAVERTAARGVTDRNMFWSIGIEQLADNPIFGIGFGMAKESVSHLPGRSGGLHGTWLQQAVELGVPGLVILIAMVGLVFMSGITTLDRVRNRLPVKGFGRGGLRLAEGGTVVAAGVAITVAISVHSFAESAFFYNSTAGFLWTYILVAISGMTGNFYNKFRDRAT